MRIEGVNQFYPTAALNQQEEHPQKGGIYRFIEPGSVHVTPLNTERVTHHGSSTTLYPIFDTVIYG